MTITQTVDIPADRRLIIEVPEEIPVGPATLIFEPIKNKRYTPNAATMTALQETSDIMNGKKKVKWGNFQPETTREEAKEKLKKTGSSGKIVEMV